MTLLGGFLPQVIHFLFSLSQSDENSEQDQPQKACPLCEFAMETQPYPVYVPLRLMPQMASLMFISRSAHLVSNSRNEEEISRRLGYLSETDQLRCIVTLVLLASEDTEKKEALKILPGTLAMSAMEALKEVFITNQ